MLGELPDQKGVAILRQRGEDAPVEAGILRGVRDGEPLVSELVSLTPTEQDPRLCDVKVHVDARPRLDASGDAAASGQAPRGREGAAHKGPARVTSSAYRTGWEALFGGSRRTDDPPN